MYQLIRKWFPSRGIRIVQAAQRGDMDTLARLLADGKDVNAMDQHGLTALMYAASKGHTGAISELLKHGAELDARDQGGRTPLMYAVVASQIDAARQLIRAGAAIDAADKDDQTALMYSAHKGHSFVVGLLLASKADVNKRNASSVSAIEAAASGKNFDVVQQLLSIT